MAYSKIDWFGVLCWIIIGIIIFLALCAIANADNTGYNSPSSVDTYGADYVSETYAYLSNNTYANQKSRNSATVTQSWETFNISIPAGSTINGIEVKVEDYFTSGASGSARVRIRSNSYGDWGVKEMTVNTTEGIETFGGPTDLWETGALDAVSWIVDDFSNTNFSLMVTWSESGSSFMYHYVDHVQVDVYYTPPASTRRVIIID